MKFDMVFEGGGAKGMVFAGALRSFEEAGHEPGRLLGTSAGAITAALVAAGYDSSRMLESLQETSGDGRPVFESFMGAPGPFSEDFVETSATASLLENLDIPKVPGFAESWIKAAVLQRFARHPTWSHLFAMIETGGWFTADRFVDWMRNKLDQGRVNGTPTACGSLSLWDFHETTGRELSLVASDTSAQQILVLNHRTAPDLPLVWAVRMSMSIPLVWPEVEWQEEWGAYRGRPMAGHLVVDGGLLSNFPIELFVSDAHHIVRVMGKKATGEVIGFLIDETLPVTGASTPEKGETQGIDWGELQTAQRVMRLVDTMTKAHDKSVIEVMEDLVVRLPAAGYGTTEFGMDAARRQALVEEGARVTREYLGGREPRETSVGLESITPMQSAADRIASGILGGDL
ncbi:MAG: patatin-like phospholipase family protein [Gemmatimonadota bacterium]